VQVFDLDEKFNISPDDINDNTCIIVSTIQSFVKENTSKYNVYKDNENLERHFVKMPASRFVDKEQRAENDRPKYSFANLFASPDTIFETFDWNIIDYAVPRLDETEFKIE
jgi:type III restriction enzyme